MKQEEKSQQSRDKILSAAIEEFGETGYYGVSLNTLLSKNGLSKGLVYHYFDNKDELYLACAAACFDALTQALSKIPTEGTAETILQLYFEARSRFFLEHPSLERIFSDALLLPPAHLYDRLAECRTGFEELNRALFHTVLGRLRLRDEVSEADAQEYFRLLQNALHLQFLFAPAQQRESVIRRYEEQAHQMMKLLLYGLAGRLSE